MPVPDKVARARPPSEPPTSVIKSAFNSIIGRGQALDNMVKSVFHSGRLKLEKELRLKILRQQSKTSDSNRNLK